ncbi:hypothetical protein M6B38_313190 [Iris pallida]|uniref:Uncharacterized protein n=1 Tax=Iris pallida TaxID=29817 RepID=A0AAX6HGB2_IRIPA|nr:hypothetical protein M6B38_313190 [Iris pallida]
MCRASPPPSIDPIFRPGKFAVIFMVGWCS